MPNNETITKNISDYYNFIYNKNNIMCDNLEFFVNISSIFSKIAYEYKDEIKEYNIPFPKEDITSSIYKAYEFILKINTNYANKFIEIIKDRKIIPFSFADKSEVVKENDKYVMYIKTNDDISDIPTIIHEFFHIINLKDNINNINYTLSELVSIYFENLYMEQSDYDYLNRYKKRMDNTYISVNSSKILGELLLLYKKDKVINENSVNSYNRIFNKNISQDFLLNNFSFVNQALDEKLDITISFRYIIGYIIYCYLKNIKGIDCYITNKMIILNEYIKNKELKLEEALNIIDIDINDKNIYSDIKKALKIEFDKVFSSKTY